MMMATRYHQWYVDERPNLFANLEYSKIEDFSPEICIPKVPSPIMGNIITKVRAQSVRTVENALSSQGRGTLYFHRTPGYWIRVMDFEPYFRSPTATRSVHHIRELKLIDVPTAKFVGAVLNSTLYFAWFFTIGNCRNLTLEDVRSFPIGVPEPILARSVGDLFDELMDNYKRNSSVKSRGVTEFQEFHWQLAKPIIDEIDRMLGSHYGFSSEEIDYVINYDIKYRIDVADAADEEANAA